jgi:hypothetical protein
MLKVFMAALMMSAPAIASAQAVFVPVDLKPCVARMVPDAKAAKRLVRELRRQGFYVTVKRPGRPARVVSEGYVAPRPGLNEGRVAISGC